MDVKTEEQHEDEGGGAKPEPATIVTPSGNVIPAPDVNGFFAQCESCDEAATPTEPPVTSTKPFRRGFCTAHAKDSPKRTIEFWAKQKKMTPRILEQGAVTQAGSLRNAKQNPKHADFHRARAFKGWPMGFEITEADFDKAVAESATPSFR